jgi:hypothetical protein
VQDSGDCLTTETQRHRDDDVDDDVDGVGVGVGIFAGWWWLAAKMDSAWMDTTHPKRELTTETQRHKGF